MPDRGSRLGSRGSWLGAGGRELGGAVLVMLAASAGAQTPAQPSAAPIDTLTFDQAIERAVTRNPSIAQAAAAVLRAESILRQARAVTLPAINGNVTTTTVNTVRKFDDTTITPRTQLVANVGVSVPLLTPLRWAERVQAADQVLVARRGADDVRREIAVAAAQAYLQIIAARRVAELNERARDTARSHFEYARQRFEGGLGSRLNMLRAQQEMSSDEASLEAARLAVRRAQEGLGVLLAADGPVDAAGAPAFEVPADTADREWWLKRPDVQFVVARQSAAERVARDSWRDYLPSVTGLFDPQYLAPSNFFLPSRSWTARVLFTVPLFDAGQRRSLLSERQSQVDLVRAERANIERQAKSEMRTAWEAVRSTERALASARAAADQAAEVVRIADLAFRAGATTNIEVIDAQRRARDGETVAVIAEDAVRRARLELLVATGGFPR